MIAQCLLWASIQLAATMSPGPAFMVTVKNALKYSRITAIATAMGLAMGVGVHMCVALTGISLLIAQSPVFYSVLKYAGASYLIYIGGKSLWTARKKFGKKTAGADKAKPFFDEHHTAGATIEPPSLYRSFAQGFLTNLLNPKALVFFTAVLVQFLSADMAASVKIAYGLISVMIEFSWFALLSVVLTNKTIQEKFLTIMHWVDTVFGVLIVYLGVQLIAKP